VFFNEYKKNRMHKHSVGGFLLSFARLLLEHLTAILASSVPAASKPLEAWAGSRISARLLIPERSCDLVRLAVWELDCFRISPPSFIAVAKQVFSARPTQRTGACLLTSY
jgi:hypothetical protein